MRISVRSKDAQKQLARTSLNLRQNPIANQTIAGFSGQKSVPE